MFSSNSLRKKRTFLQQISMAKGALLAVLPVYKCRHLSLSFVYICVFLFIYIFFYISHRNGNPWWKLSPVHQLKNSIIIPGRMTPNPNNPFMVKNEAVSVSHKLNE